MGKTLKIASTSVPSVKPPNPGNAGQLSVKTPKSKKMPNGFGKPSLFFKKEDFSDIKSPTIEKLRAFLEQTRSKK